MIPTIVILLQVVIPVALIARLLSARRFSLMAWMLFFTGVAAYIAAIGLAGVWLALPWYSGLVYLLILAAAVLWRASDIRRLRWRPRGRSGWAEVGVCAVLAVGMAALFVASVSSREAVTGAAVNLAFPLNGGSYYVANGGRRELTNAHSAPARCRGRR
jgi:hypothetical protein